MSDQCQWMDWKDISFRFCPPSVYRKLEAILLVIRGGEKLLGERLHVPRLDIDTAGKRHKSSSADILTYLTEDGQTTWRSFYEAVIDEKREDIKTDVLDRPDTQKAILDYYYNSKEYVWRKKPKTLTEDSDPMDLGDSAGKCTEKDFGLPLPVTRASPTDISVSSPVVNIYLGSPGDMTINWPTFPSPTSPNCGPFHQNSNQSVNSEPLMSGGTMEMGASTQNSVKRSISDDKEDQNKKMAGGNDMETDGPACPNAIAGCLPNIGVLLQPTGVVNQQEQNGLNCNIQVKTEPQSPQREFMQRQTAAYDSGYPSNRHGNVRYKTEATRPQKQSMQWQTTGMRPPMPKVGLRPGEPRQCNVQAKSLSHGSSVPPNRSQSLVEHVPVMGPPMPREGAEPGGTWPKAGLRSAASNASRTGSNSEPWNITYSEFRRGRLLLLFNSCSQKRACAMGRYFYDQFKIGVRLGYWSLENETCEEIGQEIMRDVDKSHWIAICLDMQYLQVIRAFENSREKYRPLPRNKNFNIRYTYALLKSRCRARGPGAHQILLFYTPDIDLKLLPAWLLSASSKTRYQLPNSPDQLLTETDRLNLLWIFRQVGLLNDHIGQRNDQARLIKRNICQ